ncbi:MAG: benzoylformate decarboxylase, partial [Actinomycetota bacterium]|nr:benzoylformate decarboxylase [Actinomycetota bacterium]
MADSGRDALLEVLRTEGVRHVFGNPGSTELPFMDALAAVDDIDYVLALQEATAVGMADGYAQATGRPAFLNLHTSAGVGNAIGNLTNAQANGTPLVVTAGQQDRRHRHHDPLLSGDLVGLARPVSKWAHEVNTLGELGLIMRRAFHDARSAPSGPVFVSIPMDLLDEKGDAPVPAVSRIERASAPAPALLDELAARLQAGARVAIVAGDEVAAAGAVPALVSVAEALGCKVHGAPLHSNIVFPTTHPLWAEGLPPLANAIAAVLSQYDVVLLVGGRAFMVYPFSPGPAVPSTVSLLHLSPDAHQLGRTWPTDLGLVGDPKASLEALRDRLGSAVDLTAARAERAATDATLERSVLETYNTVPMPPNAAAHALVRALPAHTAIVDEAV